MAKGRRRQPKGGKGGKGSGKPKTGQAWLGEATAVVWTTDQHPASSGGATVDAVAELIAVEMGDIFAGQGAWSERGRLVSQGTHAMQFDVGLETIQQWQDQGTNSQNRQNRHKISRNLSRWRYVQSKPRIADTYRRRGSLRFYWLKV